jgi:DNA-binding MarR family transcriptional regulator
LVGFIDQLEKRSLLTRSQDPSDRRRNRVRLTSEGQTLVEQLRPVAQYSQQGLLDTLSAAEQETLMSLLRRVLNANDAVRNTATEEKRMGDSARRQ